MTARRCMATLLLLGACLHPLALRAQDGHGTDDGSGAPPPLREATITERPGSAAALDVRVRDTDGKTMRLGDFLNTTRPTLLVLAYYRCTMLCGLVLDGAARAAASLARAGERKPLVAGRDYDIVTVSIDPRDTPQDAAAKRAAVLAAAGLDDGMDWLFFVADEADARALASSVGFGYAFDARSGQYAHAAAMTVLTSDGRVSRYLYGLTFATDDVREALDAAADNRATSSVGRLLLQCFHYLPSLRAWSGWMVRYYRIGGVVILVGFGLCIAWLVRRAGAREAAES